MLVFQESRGGSPSGGFPSGEVVDGTPASGMPLESPQLRPEREFEVTPYNHTWIPTKSIVEHFRALLRDFRFWANFLVFRIEKNLDLRRLNAYQRKRGDWTPQSNRLKWSSRVVLE